MLTRRHFLGALATGAAASAAAAQQAVGVDNSAMDQGATRTVRRPPKPGAAPSMTPEERDALEHTIRCQCGCTLDVFTCRTTDFSCQVSPAMHRDVMSLVEGGYSAEEIIEAFEGSYGERVLMAPKKEGFNLVGWGMPFAVMLGAGTALTLMLRGWRRRGALRAEDPAAPAWPAPASRPVGPDDATPEERARLEAAVRGEDA